MVRAVHRWPGLVALALVTLLALSGAALSVFPAAERLSAPQAAAEQTVAELAALVAATHPGLEQIRRTPSGRITAWWFDGGTPGSATVDPATGIDVGSADPNRAERWLTNLHRSLFLDDAGRLVMAAGAAAMLVLGLSGAALVARRTSGWRRWFARLRGPLAGRLHVEIARVAAPALTLSAVTALWMVASTFDLLPDGRVQLMMPAAVSGATGFPLADMAALRDVPVSELRDLSFSAADAAGDALILQTNGGTGLIDQGTGALLAWADPTIWQQVSETIYMLHTGQGAAVLGLVLGLMALGVPVMGVSGTLVWLAGRRGRPRLRDNAPAGRAETVILVGSEGGSTWGFAATLASGLRAAGQSVHVAAMAGFDPARHARAERFLILAATYGEGDAPASATGFLDRLARLREVPEAPVAVLGFGDRGFPAFCAYAAAVEAAARARGWAVLLPMATVDRQSPQDFARWGRAFGAVIGTSLELAHQPVPPETETLSLISRRDYGAEVQAPTAILRFALPRGSLPRRLLGRGFARFHAGDLLGVLPQGSTVPRFYSLASGARDGFVEVVVRKHTGGVCSGELMALEPGDTVRAFLRRNPGFHAGRGRAPLILIGAGTGIGPLAGFIRANARRRPVHLFFGMRHPSSDFLYGDDLAAWRAEGRLTRLTTAVSRGARPHYVQDALRQEAAQVIDALMRGARVMVCGGRDMAEGVARALDEILAPIGLTPALLKAEGRYVEDVY
ncbi:sulfite reductase (NADPH) flavoprotein alpha-component [Amaricoccus macauensis]|uniref:NADPH--hemoprotein reductase n=1 Tax=Amaricoccus macauensis TaxID=57001 RepID=A0A840SMY9_9RHOB|nr:PepSY domain-containing protein [Amaricoccus macauensis]MBB5221648.1 sulfite reductase (NADPH) flavoprotein alpha-component [Amaricoccus macauensis]